ncbi:MAG TPA: hypothetical protein DF712_13515 [Balneola sp.]|nr:hypothetical protein [Balneola sp.]|tara:strand:- start:625 stop:1047 length:423 start_codon:yes stop_codon:yes gene_type:complete
MNWIPPKSPYNLLQEQLYKNPWKVFVCCIFCNLTRRKQAEPYFWLFLRIYPTPQAAAMANVEELADMIQPLGLSSRRAKTLIEMSRDYILKDWSNDATKLYGIGKYGSDAYQIFCTNSWRSATPKDGALVNYHKWCLENY